MKTAWISLIVLPALVLAGCGAGSDLSPIEPQSPPLDEQAAPSANPSPIPTGPVELLPLATSTPDLSASGDITPMLNPSEPLLQKLIALATEDLAKRFSVTADQIQFTAAAEAAWPDSSLGCPKPGSSYLQVLTPGYLIRLQALDRTFEYHTDKKSLVIYCENPSPLPLDSLPNK
jgi:hypothetical protein